MTKVTWTYTWKFSSKPRQLLTKIVIRSNGRCLSGNAIWDTGATHLMITRRVVNALCLAPKH